MTRAELRQIAEDRILDAEALLAMERWSAAYYLTGYAVECVLKACILDYVLTHEEVIFGDRRFVEKCWVHDLEGLLRMAQLDEERLTEGEVNPDFAQNWRILIQWKETSRYQQTTQAAAETLFKAVTDATNGVLSWLKRR